MSPKREEKLVAHASHLLDGFLRLREKYAVLHPMLFDADVAHRWAQGPRARAFHTISSTLFTSCVLDVCSIALDRDARSPSLLQLTDALSDALLVTALRDKYSAWRGVPLPAGDPSLATILYQAVKRDEAERRTEFDAHLQGLLQRWPAFRDSRAVEAFAALRDKFLAHAELRYGDQGYQPLDVAALGLRLQDLETAICELQVLVQLMTAVFRSASFDFKILDRQLQSSPTEFWGDHRDA